MVVFFKQCGVFGWPLLLIAISNIVLFFVSVVRLSQARPEDAPRIVYGINAILFWGALGGVLGFLGQHSGLYHALTAISRARAISPNIIAMGLAESLTTTILGMTILVLSAIAWFVLRGWYRRKGLGPATEIRAA